MYNAVFGTLTITRDNNFNLNNDRYGYSEDTFNDQTSDIVGRETGLLKDINQLGRSRDALNDPEKYLKKRRKEAIKILEQVRDEYKKKYIEYFKNRRYTHEKAHQLALEEAIHLKKQLYIELNELFPVKVKVDKDVKTN